MLLQLISSYMPPNKKEKSAFDYQKTLMEKEMLFAAMNGNRQPVEEYLRCGCNINYKNVNGETVLFFAVISGDLEFVQFLISKGADINVKTKSEHTLLHNATSSGGDKVDILEFLLSKGLKVNTSISDGSTPLHIAVKYGLVEKVRWLVENGADVNKEDNSGCTPLHFAMTYSGKGNRSQVVQHILRSPKIKHSKQSKLGDTPLHIAMLKGDMDAMTQLTKIGAKIDCRFCDKGKLCQGMKERDLTFVKELMDQMKLDRKKK